MITEFAQDMVNEKRWRAPRTRERSESRSAIEARDRATVPLPLTEVPAGEVNRHVRS